MIDLLRAIVARLQTRSYSNEAAVREGVVVPILRELGWNTHDPDEVRPEYPNPAGRVDYALLRQGGRPAVLVEVKAVGRSLEGDRQLFGYCFEEGVPLAVLTDGRSWNFYLPAGIGRIDERRVHSLQLTDRTAEESEAVLVRYLARERILDRSAFAAAREDHDKAINSREAKMTLPAAWETLVAEENELLVEALQNKVEALCGFRPSEASTIRFLGRLFISPGVRTIATGEVKRSDDASTPSGTDPVPDNGSRLASRRPGSLTVKYRIFGVNRSAPNASKALLDILRTIVARDPSRLAELSDRVRSRGRRHIATTPQEINPHRPDLARAEEIAPGWLVGLTISNRDKQMIIEQACEVYGFAMPGDVDVSLPNS